MTTRETKPALLVLEDGRAFRGRAWGADGRGVRRDGLQHLDVGLSGGADRPLVRGADRLHDLPAHRQLRRQPCGRGVVAVRGSRASSCARRAGWRRTGARRSRWTITCSAGTCPAIERIDTRALVRHIRDKGAMRACISTVDLDEASLLEKARASAPMENRELASAVTTARALRSRGRGRGALSRRLLRLRREAELFERAGGSGVSRDGRAGLDARGRGHGDAAGRHLPLERAGRPGVDDGRGRRDSQSGRRGRADLRHLLRPPASGPSLRRRDLQAALRPPRRQPAGEGPADGEGRDHLAQPRLRRRVPRACPPRSRSRTSTSTTTASRGCATGACPSSPSNTTPRPRPARTTPSTTSDALSN